jgi:hypothetical protein
MKVAVVGSRTVRWFDFDALGIGAGDVVVSGGAAGADAYAAAAAAARGIRTEVHFPDYGRWGRGAPHKRNDEIVAACDRLVAVWDGRSAGTRSVIEKAARAGKPWQVVPAVVVQVVV